MRTLGTIDLKRYLPIAFGVTVVITVLPLLAILAAGSWFDVDSVFVTAPLGFALTFALASAGSLIWRKVGHTDLVFGDLLLWGYLRRLVVERRLLSVSRRFSDQKDPEIRARMLPELAARLEAADPYTNGHSKRVARHSHMIAKTMGLPTPLVDRIRAAAAVHDVGKVNTPKAILHKPDRLTDEEFDVIKKHPADGAEMVAELGDDELTAMVRHHHERLDGNGYPDGLAGDDIPLGARVIAVADTFDAITSTRPYRPAKKHSKGILIIKNEAGTQLDPAAVNAFLRYYSGRAAAGFWSGLTNLPQTLVGRLASWFTQTTAGPTIQNAVLVGVSAAILTGITGAPVITPLQPHGPGARPAALSAPSRASAGPATSAPGRRAPHAARASSRSEVPAADPSAEPVVADRTAPSAAPEVAACPTERVHLPAVADSTLDQGSPDKRYGADAEMWVQSQTGKARRSLVRFDLPNVSPGCTVQHADLLLYAESDALARFVDVYRVTRSWDEETVTWADQPAISTDVHAADIANHGWNGWNTTSLVRDQYRLGNFGLLLRDASEARMAPAWQRYSSREADEHRPELVVTYAAG